MVGHYSSRGRLVQDRLLIKSATEMFWVVDRYNAYGGRAALLPLLRMLVWARGGDGMDTHHDTCSTDSCSVLVRSASLIRRSAHIKYQTPTDTMLQDTCK